jgi:hypothetical protein
MECVYLGSRVAVRLFGSRIMVGTLLEIVEAVEVWSWRMSARGLIGVAGGNFRLALVDVSSQCPYTTLMLARGRRRRHGARNMFTGIPSSNTWSNDALAMLQTREATRIDNMKGAVGIDPRTCTLALALEVESHLDFQEASGSFRKL